MLSPAGRWILVNGPLSCFSPQGWYLSWVPPGPPGPLNPSFSARLSFSDRRINRWRNEVFKQVEYQANSPGAADSVWEKGRERCPSSAPRATWNRNVIIIAGLRIRMFFRSSNLLTYYATHIDTPGTMAWPQERFPYYANATPLSLLRRPHPVPSRLVPLHLKIPSIG